MDLLQSVFGAKYSTDLTKKAKKIHQDFTYLSRSTSIFPIFPPKINGNIQAVNYVHTSQYIGEFEMPILSSQIFIGEF